MEERLELNKIVYSILKLQIEFGTYGYGEHLPPIEEMADLLVVSVDTVRLAYRRLREVGYITLSQSIGTVVNVHYEQTEIEENILRFYAECEDSLLDICHSMPLLFMNIQLQAWKHISEEALARIENVNMNRRASTSYSVIQYLQTVYGSLNNDLLMLLIRKLNIIYMIPFFSMNDWEKYVDPAYASSEGNSVPYKIKLCRQENWEALQEAILSTMNGHYSSIKNLYQARITVPKAENQISFAWSGYKKASQIYYSVGFEILISIVDGLYPKGSFLPSIKSLSNEKKVSFNTIRNSLALLNDLGIVKTINGVGTQVLSMDQVAEHCNLSSPAVRKRFMDSKQSLQLFALSCRKTAAVTIASIDEDCRRQWLERLYEYGRQEMFNYVSAFSLKYISWNAPLRTIRTVYTELYKLLFWAVPIRGLMGSQETVNTFYRPYYHSMVACLEKSDAEGFAALLEEILCREVDRIDGLLRKSGMQEMTAEDC